MWARGDMKNQIPQKLGLTPKIGLDPNSLPTLFGVDPNAPHEEVKWKNDGQPEQNDLY